MNFVRYIHTTIQNIMNDYRMKSDIYYTFDNTYYNFSKILCSTRSMNRTIAI